MRAAGAIIWATDLRETSETMSGGKGKPGTKQYSYSVSLAVALSSRPIESVGRIWADGNLLRGEAGDLKTGGALRVHLGHADQLPDPLIAAALGSQCPAHRGLAYAVFEDLQLADFGNRIPALSFEVFADGAADQLPAALVETAETQPLANAVPAAAPIAGFANEGGSIADTLALIGAVAPLVADMVEDRLSIGPADLALASTTLPSGNRLARRRVRHPHGPAACARFRRGSDRAALLRQRARLSAGPPARGGGAPRSAASARSNCPPRCRRKAQAPLIDALRLRSVAEAERMQIRVASLDPAFAPGRVVVLAPHGLWRVEGWEWRSGGVELDLTRAADYGAAAARGDAGTPWRPADRLPAITVLEAFELPWDGTGAPDISRLHVAVGSGAGRWSARRCMRSGPGR